MKDKDNGKVMAKILNFVSIFLCMYFVVLKNNGDIQWSWIWVFSPVWIPYAIVLIPLILVLIICGITLFFTDGTKGD